MQSYAAKIVPVFSCWSLALWNISTNWKAHNVMIILKMCLFCKGWMRWRTRDREEDAFKVHLTRQTSLPPTETNSGIFHNLDMFFMLLFFRRCINYSHWWQKEKQTVALQVAPSKHFKLLLLIQSNITLCSSADHWHHEVLSVAFTETHFW